jgi:hypothetical protein
MIKIAEAEDNRSRIAYSRRSDQFKFTNEAK